MDFSERGKHSNLQPIEMVVQLSNDYAYTLEEISRLIKKPLHVTQGLVNDALDAQLLECQDFEFSRPLIHNLIQVKTVRYYRRLF